jgi:hypothetical protein
VFALGDFTGGALQQFETVSHWAPQVRQQLCPAVVISSQPVSVAVQAGQQATFRVAATSNAALRYQWFRNGVPIGESDVPSYTTPPVEISQDGSLYSVDIIAGAGRTRSVGARLTVTPGSQPWRRWLWANAGRVESNSVTTWANGVRPNESPALVLVNPDTPNSPITVEGAGQSSPVYVSGVELNQLDYLNFGNGESFPLLVRQGSFGYIVYSKGDRFWKLDLTRGASTPTSELLSSVSTRQACPNPLFISDPVLPLRSALLVLAPPAGGTCTSPNLRRLLLPMDLRAQDPPIEAEGVILTSLRWGDGSIRGFLVQRNRQVIEVDHRFRPVTTLFSVSSDTTVSVLYDGFAESGLLLIGDRNVLKLHDTSRVGEPLTITGATASDTRVIGLHTAGTKRLLFVDGAGWLKSIRLTDGGVDTHLRESAPYLTEAAADASYLALASSHRLIRFAGDGSITTLSDSAFAREQPAPLCAPTPQRIVCRFVGGGLAVVPKAGGATVMTGFGPRDLLDINSTWKVVDRTIWYQSLSRNNLEGGLRSVSDDGTGAKRLANSQLGALVDSGLAARSRAEALFQPDRWPGPYMQVFSATEGLQILDGRTGQVAVTYGATPRFATPNTVDFLLAFYRGFDTGQPQLVPMLLISGGTPFFELFMVRGNQPGLERVTRFVP